MARRVLDTSQVRAVRILAQGLPAPRGAKLAEQVKRSGFQRTLGGADAYLGVRARVPNLRRGDLEALVSEGELSVVPAVRGCMYLVPRDEVPLCLLIAARLSRARDARDAERAGILDGELNDVGEAVLQQLRGSGPLTTDGLRRTLPSGSIRSLGDRGKKVGVSSTLPPALRRLEFAGSISRVPVDGRLDHEKYEWRATCADPIAAADLPEDAVLLHARLLEGFVTRAGITNLSAFCEWSGLTKRDATAALEATDTELATGEGLGDDALCSPELARLLKRSARATAAIAFLPFADNLIHLAGGVAEWVDPIHHELQVPVWGNMKDGKNSARLGGARHVQWRSILAGGRIRGFWDYDPAQQAIVTALFDPPAKDVRKQIDIAADQVSAFVTEEVGHGRSFSLDTDDALGKRCAMLRKL